MAAQCRTAVEPLVEEPSAELMERARKVFPAQGLEQAQSRPGDSFAATVERLEAAPWKKALLCECERVTVAEFEQVASEATSYSPNDIRRRTCMGMGTCQGSFCGLRGVGAVLEAQLLPAGIRACGTGECDGRPAARRTCSRASNRNAGTASAPYCGAANCEKPNWRAACTAPPSM